MQELLLDANALIDLLALCCLRAVAGCPGFRFWVVENVQREVSRPDQRDGLERLLAEGIIGRTEVGAEDTTWLEELDTYAHLKRFLGDGEAAAWRWPTTAAGFSSAMKRAASGGRPRTSWESDFGAHLYSSRRW